MEAFSRPVPAKDNARDKSFEVVAAGFVETPHFGRCAPWDNTVIIGPRGSGKTTILKRLSLLGEAHWSRPGSHVSEFVGVYVPADPAWGRRTGDLEERAQVALFKLLVIERFLDTFRQASVARAAGIAHPHLEALRLTPRAEHQLAESFSEVLKLSPSGSIESVRDRVKATMEQIANRTVGQADSVVEWLASVSLTGTVSQLAERLADARPQNDGTVRWALLLDELELAPASVFRDAWADLRNTGDWVRLKLAFFDQRAPRRLEPMAKPPRKGNDYTETRLTWERRHDYYDFTLQLGEQLYTSCATGGVGLAEALGPSKLSPSWGGSTNRSEAVYRAAEADLLRNDESFRTWCERKVGAARLQESPVLSGRLRGKVAQTVVLRNGYRRTGTSRPLNGPVLYVGAPTILELLEGNPRHTTWLVNALCHEKSDRRHRIGEDRQQKALRHTAALLVEVLETVYPDDDPSLAPVWDLVSTIGAHLRQLSIDGPFREDPVTSFRFSARSGPSFERLVELGLDYGGFIEITRPSDEAAGYRRVRLHGLCAALHRLPLKRAASHNAQSFVAVPDPGGRVVGPSAPAQLDEAHSGANQ